MRNISPFFKIGLMLLLGCALTACGSIGKVRSDKADYKSSRTLPTLEVPPDLTAPLPDENVPVATASSATTYSNYADRRESPAATGRSGVLPEQENLRVERDGDRQWLVIQGEPEQIWPVLRRFWTGNGFVLKLDEPEIGIMETDWAENRADIPRGPIRKVIGKAFSFAYSAATRDKYRVRLERSQEQGYIELFLTHRGVEEVVQGEPGEETVTMWRPRPGDPELEAEMLKRLMLQLGVQQQRAESLLATRVDQRPKARLIQDEGQETTLVLMEPFAQAWRRTGIALDRMGFVVEDRNRSDGQYFVHYDDPENQPREKGWLSRLNPFGGKPDKDEKKYRIRLSNKAEATETRIVVLNDGDDQKDSDTSRRILTLLYDELK